jgi:hypothetical protein
MVTILSIEAGQRLEKEMQEKASEMVGTDTGSVSVVSRRPGGFSVWRYMRERLDKVTADDVEECRALYDILEHVRRQLGLVKWSSLQGYVGSIPRCVKAVGGKGR